MTITDAKSPLKILVTGASGMLGQAIARILSPSMQVIPLPRQQFNISDPNQYEQLSALSPDVIVNCAAFTQVDLAETEYELARLTNQTGPHHLATWCAKQGKRLIHFSTDYVFPGTGNRPWQEQDETQPINRYGTSKLLGEMAIQASGCDHLILRIQWLYGTGGPNFVDTMVHLLQTRSQISVVTDQIGSLTWTTDIAKQVLQLLQTPPPPGVYHLAPTGYASWYDVVCEIKRHLGLNTTVLPVSSDSFARPAKRPLNSRLNTQKIRQLDLAQIGHWEARLRCYLMSRVGASSSEITGLSPGN